MSKISFVVPVYNMEEYISECIKSICGQDYIDIEVILVNDGSTDNSYEIMNEFAKKDNRIRILNQQNKGANAARNYGLDHANGEWICFADGDDWIDYNMCTKLALYFDSDIDMLFYSYRYIYPGYVKEMKHLRTDFEIKKKEFSELQCATLNRLGPYRFNIHTMDAVSVWDKLYRLDFLKENHLRFNEALPKLQDLLFNLEVYDFAKKGYVVNKAYYNYRINDRSISHRYQPDIIEKFQIIHKYLEIFMDRHKDDERMMQAYYERIATHMRSCTVLNFCHFSNEHKYKYRKAEFLKMCDMEPFKETMKKVNLNHFTCKERILSQCIRRKWFLACELLYKVNKINEWIKSR